MKSCIIGRRAVRRAHQLLDLLTERRWTPSSYGGHPARRAQGETIEVISAFIHNVDAYHPNNRFFKSNKMPLEARDGSN
ncbi:hypothetical protein NXC14_PA00085 (plasmid) [Rhizobium sp. NXC14]|nr:hypothetical protein NXC14_PA00085 [Rhizobium sp. NXC14]